MLFTSSKLKYATKGVQNAHACNVLCASGASQTKQETVTFNLIVGRAVGQADGWTDGRENQTGGPMDRRTGGRTGRRTGRQASERRGGGIHGRADGWES